MKNNDNFYMRKMKENMALRDRMVQFVKDWETAQTEPMKEYILEDAVIDFSIFDRGIRRDELIENLAVRSNKTTWILFDP